MKQSETNMKIPGQPGRDDEPVYRYGSGWDTDTRKQFYRAYSACRDLHHKNCIMADDKAAVPTVETLAGVRWYFQRVYVAYEGCSQTIMEAALRASERPQGYYYESMARDAEQNDLRIEARDRRVKRGLIQKSSKWGN
jgi:hypothetical protein